MFLHQSAISPASKRLSGRTSFGGSLGRFSGCAGKFRPTFQLDLVDAGAGVVSLAAGYGTAATPTFTRATTAYTRLPNGLYGLVASGSPRSYYSAAGVYLGYLSEGARSNLVGGTNALVRDMSSASWVATNVTKGTTTGIDGTGAAAATLTASAGNGTILYTPGLGAADRTYSFWAKRITGSGTIQITEDGSTFTTITVTDTVNWTQYQIDSGSIVPVVGFKIVTNGDAIAVDFNMLEAATFANPTPIPVNVSKAADILTYPISGNISNSVGSAYAEFYPPSGLPTTSNGLIGDSGATVLPLGTHIASASIYDGTTQKDTVNTLNSNAINKAASAFGGSSMAIVLNGGTVQTAAFDGSMNFVNAISIAEFNGTNHLYGAIKNIKIWPAALPAATLQALTT